MVLPPRICQVQSPSHPFNSRRVLGKHKERPPFPTSVKCFDPNKKVFCFVPPLHLTTKMAPVEMPPCATTHPTNTFEHSRFQSAVALHRRAPTDQIKQIIERFIYLLRAVSNTHPTHTHARTRACTRTHSSVQHRSPSVHLFYSLPSARARYDLFKRQGPSFHSLNATHQYTEQV